LNETAVARMLNPSAKEERMTKIVPFLWYTKEAEQAAAFYASVLPNSRVDSITTIPVNTPSGPAETVKVVEFTLIGQKFVAFNGGPLDAFNHAISFTVECDGQAEIDRLWSALSEGGQTRQCGWLADRYGLMWQIVPAVMAEMMKDPDRAKARRATEAMLKMTKFDIAELKAAFNGNS
jgi:predicted 3-demethylubiquinone-9 3-methyltransferase (glyoxalase superfamily)